ncbi:MAG: DUF2752 domain-containing protein [Planctomycetaceae bacterium]
MPEPPPLPADHADTREIVSKTDNHVLSETAAANTEAVLSNSPSHLSLQYTPLTRRHRTLLAGFGFFLLCGFLLAAYLKPSPAGFGTHRSLGLPPCSFIVMFGKPCPSCGMTTSFAHFVRGQLPSSLRANAAGTILAATCVVLMVWSFCCAWSGRYVWFSEPVNLLAYGLSGLAAITLLHWVWRLWLDGYV